MAGLFWPKTFADLRRRSAMTGTAKKSTNDGRVFSSWWEAREI
jgi:hypothetical protein